MFSETGSRDAVTAAVSVAITKDRLTEKTIGKAEERRNFDRGGGFRRRIYRIRYEND